MSGVFIYLCASPLNPKDNNKCLIVADVTTDKYVVAMFAIPHKAVSRIFLKE